MADSIFQRQNDVFLIQCQIAKKYEYLRAKHIFLAKTIIAFAFAVLSIITTILDVDGLTATTCLLAVVLALLNKHLDEYASTHKKQAAAIQQYIDVTLFAPAIGGGVTEWGDVPNKSDLACVVGLYENADAGEVEKMRNWYDDYSSLPGESQVFYCQCENIRWDYDLHKKFKMMQIILLSIIALVMTIAFLVVNPSVVKMICLLSWIAPLAEFAYSIYIEVNRSILMLQNLECRSKKIAKILDLNDACSVRKKLIQFQHKIYEKRATGFMIPEWFYMKHKKRRQRQEENIAKLIQAPNA